MLIHHNTIYHSHLMILREYIDFFTPIVFGFYEWYTSSFARKTFERDCENKGRPCHGGWGGFRVKLFFSSLSLIVRRDCVHSKIAWAWLRADNLMRFPNNSA